MCDQEYDLLWWSEPPLVDYAADNCTGEMYEGVVVEQFFAAFQSCCNGSLPKFVHHRFDSQELMMHHIRNMSIAMPVSYGSRVLLHDPGIFLRVIDSSGLAFVTQMPKESEGNLMAQGLETVWPLLILIIITCGYAGLVFWIAEFTVKKEHRQIERSFLKGMFDGYWCAFISATTVGYGDKVTESRFGKLLTILWLLFGLGLMASFTAAMTQLMSSSYLDMSQPISMKDCSSVGVINGSLAHQIVTEIGLKTIVTKSFDELHELLENGTIDGFALGQYYCSYHMHQIDEAFVVAMGQSEPITTGVVYNAICPACNTLKMCMAHYLFVRSLDYSRNLEKHLNHRHEEKLSALGMATQALGRDHTYLGFMAAVLVALLLITWAIDYTVTRYKKNRRKKEQESNMKDNDTEAKNGVIEVLIAK